MKLKIGDIVIGYGANLYEIIDIQNDEYILKIIKILHIDEIYPYYIGQISTTHIEDSKIGRAHV